MIVEIILKENKTCINQFSSLFGISLKDCLIEKLYKVTVIEHLYLILKIIRLLNKLQLTKFIEWVKYNQLTINWKKTKFMIISEKRFTKEKLDFLLLDGNNVEVVEKFSLLGVTIDNCLTFQDHISALKQKVNIKLFSIKKLKFLSLSTKIHFFKTFIQPHFDYCSTIFTFFNKKLFCNIVKFYNLCIYRLLNINICK